MVRRPATRRRGMDKQRRYLSYMLRLWETSNGERQIWRASLESPGSGERQGFASLRDLIQFLEAQTEHQEKRDGEADGHGGGGTVGRA
jgi:hypothetical protein